MKSIYSKLIVGFIASIIISFSLAGYFAIRMYSNSLMEMAKDELRNSANAFIETTNNLKNEEALNQVLEALAKGTNTTYFLYTKDNQLITFGDGEELKEDELFNITTIGYEKLQLSSSIDRIINENIFIENTYSSDRLDNHFVTSEVVRINNENYVLFLRKNVSQQEIIFQQTALLAFGSILVSGSVIFLIVADIIVKPITRITKATNEVIKGNYHVKINYYGKDELATLNHSFNQMASQLAKTEEMRQQFISDISHEFQTPLTSIQGFAKILSSENISEEQRQKYTDIILFQSQRLSTLSKNMLQLTLLEGEDIQIEKKTYPLLEQLNRVVSTQLQEASAKNIEIEKIFPKKDILIQADENRLEQVWINIINNAVKYTLEDGVITIRVRRTQKDIEVTIEDTGVGISEEASNHIFDRFYREDSSRTIQGNGLGLSIAKRIIELHNGSISVTSRLDVGSVFKILLPYERETFRSKYSKNIEKESKENEIIAKED